MAFLLWKTIQEAESNGLEEFDMGRSEIDDLGLIAFKEHWGAVATPVSYWTSPYKSAVSPRAWQNRLVRRAVSVASDSVLEAVGTLLYRHIG